MTVDPERSMNNQESAKSLSEKNTYPFFPDHVTMEMIIGLFLLGFLTIMTILFYPELGPKANPLVTPEHIKPEWYFFPIFRWIKLTPEWLGLLGQMVGAMIFVLWPIIDAVIVKKLNSKLFSPIFGSFIMILLIVFMLWEAFI